MLAGGLLLGFSSCQKSRTQKSARQSQTLTLPDSLRLTKQDSAQTDTIFLAEEANTNFMVEEVNFNYLTAKSKFSFKSRTQNIDNANVNIRIKKDSLIWFSVTGVGFEVARGLITPSRIVFMDKFHKEYFDFSYEEVSVRFNFNLTYDLLQSLIVGNLPLPLKPNQKVRHDQDLFLIRQQDGRITIDNYIGEKNRKLKRLQAVEQPTNNSLTLDYDDFTELNNYLFPFTSLLTLDVKSQQDQQYYQTVIRIKHSKVDLPDTSPGFPFVIPDSYQKK
jgi:ATP-dependent exoDNAse (exonuclease V) alpha subunit